MFQHDSVSRLNLVIVRKSNHFLNQIFTIKNVMIPTVPMPAVGIPTVLIMSAVQILVFVGLQKFYFLDIKLRLHKENEDPHRELCLKMWTHPFDDLDKIGIIFINF